MPVRYNHKSAIFMIADGNTAKQDSASTQFQKNSALKQSFLLQKCVDANMSLSLLNLY